MSENDVDLEELVDQHKDETSDGRHATKAAVERDTDDDTPTLVDAVADAYEKLDNNDLSSNLTLRDENLAALFHGLEDANQLKDVGAAAADEIGWDQSDTDTRAGVLRALVRIGLTQIDDAGGESDDDADGRIIQAGKDGRRQYYDSDDF